MCLSVITPVTAADSLNRVPSTFVGYDSEYNNVEIKYNYVENVVVKIPGTEVTFELEKVSENVSITTDGLYTDVPKYVFNFYEKESRVFFTDTAVVSIGSYGWWYEDGVAIGTGDVAPGECDLHIVSGGVLQSDYTTSHEQYLMRILEDGTIASYSNEGNTVAVVELCFNTCEAYPYNSTEDISKFIISDLTSYSIIDGANSVVNSNENALTIRADGDFDKFTGVKVDGELVDSSNYTATEGSTIIEFKADYLETLEAGEHTVSVVFTDGEATTKFEVKNYAFTIQEPSITEIRNKDGIVLHANIEGNVPDGSYVVWESSNDNFCEVVDGNKLEIIAENKGYTTFKATLYDINGNVLASETIEMYSKSGFFDKIGGFFRSIFGLTIIHEN